MNPEDKTGEVEETGATIDELPPEMLTNLLKYVDTRWLFKCRLVSRQWCSISSGILCDRPDTEIEFRFESDDGYTTSFKNGRAQELKDFIECSKASKNWPYARLSIVDDDYDDTPVIKYFEHEDWTRFLSDYDISSIKSLKLGFSDRDDEDSIDILTEKIRGLLLHKFLYLEELQLLLGYDPDPVGTKLFHYGPRLPYLKSLRFNNYMFPFHPEICKDLLNAAVNLKRIHVYNEDRRFFPETVEFLHSLGKLDLLQEAEIQLNEHFLTTVKKYADSSFTLKLKELKLKTADILNQPSCWEDATRFLSRLFETSGDSLRKLNMEPLGFLHGLQFSSLKNLSNLTLERRSSTDILFFPAGVRTLDIFPAVNRLDLNAVRDWCVGFPTEDSIPRLPSLKILKVTNKRITGNTITVLALLCPNLKDLQLQRVQSGNYNLPRLNFLQVGRAIWTHMPKLESLELDIDAGSTKNNSAALSSCLTGMSVESCRRLHEMKRAAQTLKRFGISVDIPESELQAVREHPSILDMKELRKLTVNSYSKNKPLGTKAFSNKLAWLTQEYALNHLPHLEINGVKATEIK